MLSKAPALLLLLPAILRSALAQNSNSTACNNSPLLCDRQYNLVTHLGAHDSPFLRTTENSFTTSGNQFYNSTVQLQAGVRLLSTQVQYVTASAQWHVCHSSCDLLDAGTLSNWLGEIKAWMDNNPNEVVTLLLVTDATASDLAAQYQTAGIDSYVYTPSFTSATSEWPTLQQLINNGTRLITFVPGLDNNSGASYLLNEWDYVFENPYSVINRGDCTGNYSCAAERPNTNTASMLSNGMMPLMNHLLYQQFAFGIETPNATCAPTVNSPGSETGNLGLAATQCARQWSRNPWCLLVDFFNVGPAIETVDSLNGVSSPVGRQSVSTAVLSDVSGAANTRLQAAMWIAVLMVGFSTISALI